MNNDELKMLIKLRSNLIMEYITQIISDPGKVIGIIKLNQAEIAGFNVVVLDIYVPIKGFERHFDLGVNIKDIDSFTSQILKDLKKNFLASEKVILSKYEDHEMKDHTYIKGIKIKSSMNSEVILEFVTQGEKFKRQIANYNGKLTN